MPSLLSQFVVVCPKRTHENDHERLYPHCHAQFLGVGVAVGVRVGVRGLVVARGVRVGVRVGVRRGVRVSVARVNGDWPTSGETVLSGEVWRRPRPFSLAPRRPTRGMNREIAPKNNRRATRRVRGLCIESTLLFAVRWIGCAV
jgi:hypothetical protein